MSNLIYIILAMPFICGSMPLICGAVWIVSQLCGFTFSYLLGVKVWAVMTILTCAAIAALMKGKGRK